MCTGACGLMSLIATNPFAWCTYAPSRAMSQKRQPSSRFAKNTLLHHARATHRHELADRSVDQPRRVVVAVAAARPVDEHRVGRADLRVPAADAELVRERAQPRSPFLLDRRRDR